MNFPAINMINTGRNIEILRKQHGLSVKQLQTILGFTTPQAIYKWQNGSSLPSIDNLIALSVIFSVPIEKILVTNQVS